MDVNSLPKTVTRRRRGCDLNPGPSAPESSTLTIRQPSHPNKVSGNTVRCSGVQADVQLVSTRSLATSRVSGVR